MTTLKGIFSHSEVPKRKNFLQENVRNIRQMEKFFHSTKETQIPLSQNNKKYQNVVPRVNSRCSTEIYRNKSPERKFQLTGQSLNRKSSAPTGSTSDKSLKKPPRSVETGLKRRTQGQTILNNNQTSGKDLSKALLDLKINKNSTESAEKKKTTSQGSQTMDFDYLSYSEDMVRYPSTSNSQRKSPSSIDANLHLNRGDDVQKVNYIKLNKEKTCVPVKTTSSVKNGDLPVNYKKGIVPKYIQERKEEQHKKNLEQAKDVAYYADCPEGHIPLSDNERKETLKMLKQNYQGFVDELNKMPIRSDTLRSQTRKIEIEKQLSKLEEGIKIFSRSKVFVKINS